MTADRHQEAHTALEAGVSSATASSRAHASDPLDRAIVEQDWPRALALWQDGHRLDGMAHDQLLIHLALLDDPASGEFIEAVLNDPQASPPVGPRGQAPALAWFIRHRREPQIQALLAWLDPAASQPADVRQACAMRGRLPGVPRQRQRSPAQPAAGGRPRLHAGTPAHHVGRGRRARTRLHQRQVEHQAPDGGPGRRVRQRS